MYNPFKQNHVVVQEVNQYIIVNDVPDVKKFMQKAVIAIVIAGILFLTKRPVAGIDIVTKK